MLSKVADDCVCVIVPEAFHAVGLWYEDFTQTSNEEVRRLLNDARARTLSVDASEHALSS
jgi:predicted phosphoribosyltransferase